jgi:beta-glucanase (GH16 family)
MKKKVLTLFLLQLCFCFAMIQLNSCKKEDNPVLTVKAGSQARSKTDATLKFQVTLSKSSSGTVSVDYEMKDGTAVSPEDYTATPGTLTISSGQTQATIEIQIKGDPSDVRESNLQFKIILSNPKSCDLATESATGTIVTQDGTNLTTDNTGYTTPASYPGYTLVWSDEFSGKELDVTSWNEEMGNGSGGWGNNELEYYTGSPKNIFLSNGNLVIEARRETIDRFDYTSSRITTQGKKTFKYGRIDIRAKLPVSKGMWPALWMLGSNISSAGWPACGETDIMELVGTYPSRVTGTMHWKALNGSAIHKGADYSLASGDFSQEFHVFSIIWSEDNIEWKVDDQTYLSTSASDVGSANYPFNAEQFFIFNVAVGGNWPGPPDNTTVFPQRMFVDYVRIFQ